MQRPQCKCSVSRRQPRWLQQFVNWTAAGQCACWRHIWFVYTAHGTTFTAANPSAVSLLFTSLWVLGGCKMPPVSETEQSIASQRMLGWDGHWAAR
jgi:hypothetical protein